MNLSQFESIDPLLLPGLFNTALRNDSEDLNDLVLTHDLDKEALVLKMCEIGYRYCDSTNQFRPIQAGES